MSDHHALQQRVTELTDGTPYVVTPTDKGFDVAIKVVDAQWRNLFLKAGLRKSFTHHVSVDGDTYSITDDATTVHWKNGIPTLSGEVERFIGRKIDISFEKSWAFDENGKFGKVVDYSFSSEEGRQLINMAAEELGLTPRRGAAEKAGLFIGLGTIAALVICAVVVLIVLLLR